MECEEKFEIFNGDEVRLLKQECLLLEEKHAAKVIKTSDSPSLFGKNFLIEYKNGTRIWVPSINTEKVINKVINAVEEGDFNNKFKLNPYKNE